MSEVLEANNYCIYKTLFLITFVYYQLLSGAAKPYEAIFVSSTPTNPLIVILHGGPHSVSLASYTKSSAFLSSLGFNLLIVNYRYGHNNAHGVDRSYGSLTTRVLLFTK